MSLPTFSNIDRKKCLNVLKNHNPAHKYRKQIIIPGVKATALFLRLEAAENLIGLDRKSAEYEANILRWREICAKGDPDYEDYECATRNCRRKVLVYDGDHWCAKDFKRVTRLRAKRLI